MAEEYTPDYSYPIPDELTREKYKAALNRIDARSVGRGPIADRPTDMSADAVWIVTTGDGTTPDNSITRYDSSASEWVTVGPEIGDTLGSESSPLAAVHSDLVDADDLEASDATLPQISGSNIDVGDTATWFKIGSLSGDGANCKLLITETSSFTNADSTGIEIANFKHGNAAGEVGGHWFELAPNTGNNSNADFGVVETSDLETDIYYKAGTYTHASAIVLDGAVGLTLDFQEVGTTEPSDLVNLTELFPVASPAELSGGVENGLDVSGTVTQNTDPVATVPFVNTNTVQESQSWDGTSLIQETGSGDTIEYISEN